MFSWKHIDRVCLAAFAAAALLACAFAAAGRLGLVASAAENPAYLEFFDDSRVHSVDLAVEGWDAFLASAPEEEYVRCDVTLDGETVRGAGLRVKGNNSMRHVTESGGVRYSLKIEFDHYDASVTYRGLDKMSLDASFQDNSYLKSYLAYDMMRFMGVPAPATSYVQVTVNGEPWGLYLAVEDMEDAFAERTWGEGHGVLYKPDYLDLEDENRDVALQYSGDDPSAYPNIFREARTDMTGEDAERLVGALRLLDEAGALSQTDQDAAAEMVEQAVDVDAVLRYFAVQTFTANLDSYLGRTGHNYILYESGGRISMLPWDYNLAFGTYALGRPELADEATTWVNLPIDTPASGDVMLNRPLFHHLMLIDRYHDQYRSYLDELVGTYVESGELTRRLRTAAELIAPYVKEDPTAFCSFEDHLLAVDTIEEFCLLRAESVRGQLQGSVPSSIAEQEEAAAAGESPYVDASHIRLEDMGELADLA